MTRQAGVEGLPGGAAGLAADLAGQVSADVAERELDLLVEGEHGLARRQLRPRSRSGCVSARTLFKSALNDCIRCR